MIPGITGPRRQLHIDLTTEYLRFHREYEEEVGKKTQVWAVQSRSSGYTLGMIRWYSPWRQYVFYPAAETLFNRACMSDIQGMIGQLMDERRRS